MKRQNGILMPIFSLPNKYGIGSFGEEAYEFVDKLAESKVEVWQILPLVQTGYGNSPYSSVSMNSFNPYFISLNLLKAQKLLTAKELKSAEISGKYIDYAKLYEVRYPLLRKAFSRFDLKDENFVSFLKDKKVKDYALYMAIKEKLNFAPFYQWEDGLKLRDKTALKKFEKENKQEILFWEFLQFIAKEQWFDLKNYANSLGVKIMGDMPLYVALDSVDVWTDAKLFKLNSDFTPKKVAGVPPDYFSQDGQLWGNPVYDYDEHKKDNFAWWTARLKSALKTFDLVRIDHFRGLDRYYEIENGAENAKVGEWVTVPSKELFDTLHKTISKNRIVAEDLGIIDDGVRELLAYTGYPGMKILSFAFDGREDNLYLPQNINKNSVCYTGTHDNDTLIGLLEGFDEWNYNLIKTGVKNSLKALKIRGRVNTIKSLARSILKLGFACPSSLFIAPMQDLLLLNKEYRINEPGTVKEQNWAIKFNKRFFKKSIIKKLQLFSEKYRR